MDHFVERGLWDMGVYFYSDDFKRLLSEGIVHRKAKRQFTVYLNENGKKKILSAENALRRRNRLGTFFYGAMLNIFCLLVSIFLEDRYLLICLPMMMKYMYSVVVTKIESNAMEKQDGLLLERVEKFRLETILDFTFTKDQVVTAGMICFTYVVCWRVFVWVMKRRRDCGA